MKVIHSGSGPFRRRLFFEKHEIDDIAIDELKSVGLLPDQPSPIRIERFIEKRFGISPSYQELPHGILGYSRFTEEGCKEIVVSKTLSESIGFVAERRVSSTLAHEAGHALLHSDLFVATHGTTKMKMITNDVPSNQKDILCRSDVVGDLKGSSSHSGYRGDWWEYQANLMIGALLLPRPLLRKSLIPILTSQGACEIETLELDAREAATQLVVNVFEVNPVVARIRIDDIFSPQQYGQLTL